MTEPTGAGQAEGDGREVVLIVGASSDIGLELIRRLAPGGPLVLAHYHRSLEKLEQLRATPLAAEIVPLHADLSQREDVARLAATLAERYPTPEKIVHLAAPKLEFVRFKETSWERFQRELDVQLGSIVTLLQPLLPGMARRKRGKIVFVLSSTTLFMPPGALSHYVTAKYALLGLMRSLAAEYNARHINVNAVSPSMVETAFLENLPERMVELTAAQSPRQRNATPQDVAGVIQFLLSPEADYMTGVNIPVTGGSNF